MSRFHTVTEVVAGTEIRIETFTNLDREIDRICEGHSEMSTAQIEHALDLSPYYGVIWPAARGLCVELSKVDWRSPGYRVIEMGCGLALPSLYLAKQGVDITATDFHPETHERVVRNSALNEVRLNYFQLDWRNPPSDDLPFDRVIASDILYERKMIADVAKSLTKWVTSSGEIWISDPGRSYLQEAVLAFQKLGWKSELKTAGEMFVFRFYGFSGGGASESFF